MPFADRLADRRRRAVVIDANERDRGCADDRLFAAVYAIPPDLNSYRDRRIAEVFDIAIESNVIAHFEWLLK